MYIKTCVGTLYLTYGLRDRFSAALVKWLYCSKSLTRKLSDFLS